MMSRINSYLAPSSLVLLVYVALITFLPSVQFMPKYIIWFNDRQRLLELLLLSLVLLDGVFIGFNRAILIPVNHKLRKAFFLLLTLASISALLAQSPKHAVIEVSVFAALSYLALFVARLYHENKEVFTKRITYALWASILLYMVSFYTGYVTATIFKTPLHWPFPFTGFSNIRSFNQYQLWTLGLICLPLLTFEIKKNNRFCLHLALTCWWVLLFYSASRGVLIAWLAGMLLTAFIYRKLAWPFLRLQFINIATGYSSYYILFKIVPALHQSTLITGTIIRDTANDRIALWDKALILIRDFPLFGVGPMHYAWHNSTNGHPHNSLLQLAAEWGLPATLVMLAIIGYGISCWLKRFNVNKPQVQPKLDCNLAILLFFTLIANAAYSLVDGVIVSPISQVLMFTMIGLMIGQYTYGHFTITENKYRLRSIFAGFLFAAMVWSTLPEIVQGLSGNEKGFSMGYAAAGPRFWHETK